jgi:hypothetical protein
VGKEAEQAEAVVDAHDDTAPLGEGVALVEELAAASIAVVAPVDPHHHRESLCVRRRPNIEGEAVLVLVDLDELERGCDGLAPDRTQPDARDDVVEELIEHRCALMCRRPERGALLRPSPALGRRGRSPATIPDRWRRVGDALEDGDRAAVLELAANLAACRGRLDRVPANLGHV